MIDVATLRDDCALMVHDPAYSEITKPQWLIFMRSAAADARNAGWLIRSEDDESITVTATAYDYTVPQPFAYIQTLILSETVNGVVNYIEEIPRSHWDIRLNGGVPTISFDTISSLVSGRTIKVIGQKRPTTYTSADEPVDAGMDSFLRERAMYFAFRYMGAGSSELAAFRRQMAQQCWQTSEMFLHRHPQEFRAAPSSVEVPGRG